MNCMKLFGQKLGARDFNRQVAELQVRIAVLNPYTVLGMPITQRVPWLLQGKGGAHADAR